MILAEGVLGGRLAGRRRGKVGAVRGWSVVGMEVGGRKESWGGSGGGCAGRGVRRGWGVRGGVKVCGHEGGCGERWVRMSLRSGILITVDPLHFVRRRAVSLRIASNRIMRSTAE